MCVDRIAKANIFYDNSEGYTISNKNNAPHNKSHRKVVRVGNLYEKI